MSRRSRFEGLDQAIYFIESLPTAAHEEMAVELGIVAREVLAAQQADVPKDTGALAASLSYRVNAESLSATVGILGRSRVDRKQNRTVTNYGDSFYGLIVEHGRRKQVVNVTRRVARKYRGNGKQSKRQVIYLNQTTRLRRRRKNSPNLNAGTPIGSPYKMQVKAKAGRPFVHQPLFQEVADRSLADFWSKALTRTGRR